MEINKQVDAAEEARQKEYKRIKDAMKADIKIGSTAQTILKNSTLRVPHTMSTGMDQVNAHLNRVDLRHLFLAYAIFRIQGGRKKGIPEQNYGFSLQAGTIVRRDGKAIRADENAPNIDLVNKILEKYGATIKQSKTVHLNQS